MSNKELVRLVLNQHPEFRAFSKRQLRVVRCALEEMAVMSSGNVLTEEETTQLFQKFVPDLGKPSAALRAYRKREDLTQRELSKKCGIPQPHISAMESGKRTIGLTAAKKLALALRIDYRKLV